MSRSWCVWTLLCLGGWSLVGTGLTGCAHGQTTEERSMAKLRDELSRVESERDRLDQRLSLLEVQAADQKPAPKQASAAPATPHLRVVHLAPDGTEIAAGSSETAGALNGEDPDDTTPRPSLRVSGIAEPRGGRKSHARPPDLIEQTLPPETPNGGSAGPAVRAEAGRPSALDPEARRHYDAALALVNGHRYAEALDAFAAFLLRWPDHPYADNATYWRGECYFAQGELARAAEQFEGTLARFPLGNKVSDSLLKLGMVYSKLGDAPRAKTYFERLRREFPRSEAAKRAPQ